MKIYKFKSKMWYLLIVFIIISSFFILYPERIWTKSGSCMCIGVDKSYYDGMLWQKCLGISYDCSWPDVNWTNN